MHLFEFLYYLGFSAKQYYSLRRQKHLPCKVISIGNITVGGTGKTPATIAVAEEAQKRGLNPVVLTRGYGGTARGPCFVTKGKEPLLSVKEAGDEPVLMAERLKGVPIIKNASRFEAGMFALRELQIRDSDLKTHVFILDDGFQHVALYRDRDIVLIDAENPFGNGLLLPFGRMREPVKSLARADIIVLTRAGEKAGHGGPYGIDILKEKINSYNEKSRIFLAEHVPLSCSFLSGQENPADWLAGKKVFGFCALGSPDAFRTTLLESGADIRGFRAYRDHYQYTPEDIFRIKTEAGQSGAEWIVTTEKDIIKARNLELPDNISVIKVVFAVKDGFFETVFSL
jgi:tetraacyldisaccharide 4'-kinase